METIRTYLENMFAGLPDDERLVRAKADLLSTMEDKYNSLKADGKSENEAVGAVISDFGNIDELLEELEISRSQSAADAEHTADNAALFVSDEDADEYLRTRSGSGWLVGIGVFLCLLAPATLIAMSSVLDMLGGNIGSTFGIVTMLMIIAVAVILFIVCGIKDEKYDIYDKATIALNEATRKRVNAIYESRKIGTGVGVGIGILVILIGVCVVIAGGELFRNTLVEDLSVSIMLILIGLGVFIIIKSGINLEGCKNLLNIEKNVTVDADGNSVVSRGKRAVAVFEAILWPVTLITYFIWSFGFGGWAISWIVFPVAGILNGCVASAIKAGTK